MILRAETGAVVVEKYVRLIIYVAGADICLSIPRAAGAVSLNKYVLECA
jgi:hypothetical protein